MRDAVREWQALSALYEQAETLTASELDLWLVRLRGEGHPLVEPLAQMLGARADVRDNGFLSELPRLPAPASSLNEDRAGERIGPYRLLAPIGSGGMAEVWRAERDDGAFRRTVAIKLLFRHLGGARGESFAQRFSRERDILASLDHPNIAGLHDAGVTPGGQPWLALEYVEGEPLLAWCDRARIGVRARVEVFRQVLLAVEHAHANLVIHRDLKPGNILVSAVGEVRLLDFGIAKLMESADGVQDDSELTRRAGRLMTVAYASPEQLTGRPLTTATDVYSLGVVLYELLCGERPYEVRTDLAARLEQAILETDPRPPSRRMLSDATADARGTTAPALRKLLVDDLDAVVLRALAKQPFQRYGSVEALRAELDRWLGGEPVDARTPGRLERLGRFVCRHPVGFSLGAAAVAALLTVAGVAVALGLQARGESARATAARDFLMGMFRQADTDKSHGADVTARELLDRGRDDVLRRLKDQPALQVDLLQGIAGIQSSMGEVTKADVTLDALAKLHRRLGDPLATARALAARADNALRLGQLDLARSLVAEIDALPRAAHGDAGVTIDVALTRGWLALWGGDAVSAKALFLQALARAEAAFGTDSTRALTALVGAVQARAAMRDFAGALVTQQDLANRQQRAPDKTRRSMIELDVGRAELLYLAGDYSGVSRLHEVASPKCAEALGDGDETCRRLTNVGAQADLHLGRPAAVLGDLPVLQAMAEDVSSPDMQAMAIATLLRTYAKAGRSAGRPDLLSRALELAAVQPHPTTSAVQQVILMQAVVEYALSEARLADAARWIDELQRLQTYRDDGKLGHVSTATTELLRGILYLRRDKPQDALEAMQRAQITESAVLGELHPLTLLHSLNQIGALTALHQVENALKVIDRADPVLGRSLGTHAPVYEGVAALRNALLKCRAEDDVARQKCLARPEFKSLLQKATFL